MNYDIKQVSPIFKGINYFSLFKLIRSSWLTEGKYSALLNERILDLCNAKYGVFAPNGTLSITMALLATGLKPGDRVLIPDTTFLVQRLQLFWQEEFLFQFPWILNTI